MTCPLTHCYLNKTCHFSTCSSWSLRSLPFLGLHTLLFTDFLGKDKGNRIPQHRMKNISSQEIRNLGVYTVADCCVWSFCLLAGIAHGKQIESLVIDVGCWIWSEKRCTLCPWSNHGEKLLVPLKSTQLPNFAKVVWQVIFFMSYHFYPKSMQTG